MIRAILVAMLVLSGCSRGIWVSESDPVKIEQDLCEVSRSFDLVAHANLIEIGESKDVLFARWPESFLRVTEIVIDVDDPIRGDKGKMKVLISAPERDGKLKTSSRVTAVGSGGWVLGAMLEHAQGGATSMFLDSQGFSPSDEKQVKFDWFGSYETGSLRSQFEKLPTECTRGASAKR